MDFEVEGVKT